MRIFIIVFFLTGLASKAQNYSYHITDYKNGLPSTMVGVAGDQFKRTITFTNSSTAPIYLHVKRTQKSIPLYWSLSYYYVQACSPSQDTISVKVPASSSTVLTLHIKTDSVKPGIATASFRMYQAGLEDDAETFNLTASTKGFDVGFGLKMQPGEIQIFPNPANNLINITATETKTTTITICDLLGIEKFKTENVVLPHSVDVSEYAPGIYFVEISYGNMSHLEKIMKN